MLGAIIGDIVGSRFEWDNIKSKDFELFSKQCHYTDDTVMTCAVADALVNNKDITKTLQEYGRNYPHKGYGGSFGAWIYSSNPQPYNSWGNGSAMRVSAVGWFAKTETETMRLAEEVTKITHNHPEGMKGAKVTAMCVFMARHGYTKEQIRKYAIKHYPIIESMSYSNLIKNYHFDVSCQGSVPQAIFCFLISDSFEDCIRTVISIGGDSDTLGAIAGAIAEAYYFGINHDYQELCKEVIKFFPTAHDKKLLEPLKKIYEMCGINLII